jgi:hypothetical protein
MAIDTRRRGVSSVQRGAAAEYYRRIRLLFPRGHLKLVGTDNRTAKIGRHFVRDALSVAIENAE